MDPQRRPPSVQRSQGGLEKPPDFAVPFAEEAFFRGFAYRVLRARFGAGAAVVTTAVGFALGHGLAPGAWLPVVPIGLILALLVEGSGSLWPAVAAHATVNVLAVLLP